MTEMNDPFEPFEPFKRLALELLFCRSGSLDASYASDQVFFEKFWEGWTDNYSQMFEPSELYDVRDAKEDFLEFCAAEFDRHSNRKYGKAHRDGR